MEATKTNANVKRPRKPLNIFPYVNGVLFVIICLIILVPIWKVLVDSFDLTTGYGMKLWPDNFGLDGYTTVRVAFNGTQTTDKPLVASLAIECNALVSILAADTRIVNGQTLGSMLLALPNDENREKALEYIKNYPGITYEEVNG